MSQRYGILLLLLSFASPVGAAGPDMEIEEKTGDPSNHVWLSGAYGGYDAGSKNDEKNAGVAAVFGLYGGEGQGVVGLRDAAYLNLGAAFACGFSFGTECNNVGVSEQALVFGKFLGSSKNAWAATGIARTVFLNEKQSGEKQKITVGLPLELVLSPHFPVLGLEFRLVGNLNGRDSFAAGLIGLRFGDLD